MIVRHLKKAATTPRRVVSETWESTRLLLKNDAMGFSFHITTMYAGTETAMHYQNHLEAVYCISGRGELEDKATGQRYPITPGMIYALDGHDAHVVRAKTNLKLACVFNPPLHGLEVHDASGAYPREAQSVEG